MSRVTFPDKFPDIPVHNSDNEIFYFILFILFICLLSFNIFVVNTNEVYLITRFGKINRVVKNGLNFKIPLLESKHSFSLKNHIIEITEDVYTKDIQPIKVKISVISNVKLERVVDIYQLYSKEDNYYQYLNPIIISTLKNVIGLYKSEEIIDRRVEIESKILNDLKSKIDFSKIYNFQILDIDYFEEFEKVIEEKQMALERYKKEQYETKIIEEKAKQKLIEAETEAKALSIKEKSISNNKNIIYLEFINKWDGKLPTTVIDTIFNSLLRK